MNYDPNQQQQQYMMMNQNPNMMGQFDQQNPNMNQQMQQGGMPHQNMPMAGGPQQQRMQMMDQQRPNFPQQIQRVPSQGTFQMNTGQPPSNPQQQQYMIRQPQQNQMQGMHPNMMMNQNPMQQQQPGPMSQRMNTQGGNMQPQPRLMHPTYANSPQPNQPTSVPNIPSAGPGSQIRALYDQMPPELRQKFNEVDNAGKNTILRDFTGRLRMHSANATHPNMPNMPMGGPQQQQQQRPNFPPQQSMQQHQVSSQSNFPMSSNQPPHLQQAHTPQQQQYLIRNPPQQQQQQQTPQNVMKHSPMPPQPQSVSGPGSMPQRTGPPSVGNIPQPRSMHSNYANSPQINQPASVQNVQPQTAQTPRPTAPTPTPINTDDPEYKKVLGELKSYHKDTKILLERVKVDGHENLEKSLLRVLEIMEGKREADIKMLNKLLLNLKNSIRQHNPMKTMFDFCNRINTVPQNLDSPILPEGWETLDKFRIRVPASVLKHIEKVKEQEQQSRKRKLSDESDSGDNEVQIPCVYQTASKLTLPSEISEELMPYNFSIDYDCIPISEHVLFTQILVEFKPKEIDKFKYSIPPLRLSIPVKNYPKMPIQLVPFNQEDPLQSRIMDALKKNITDDSIMHSIKNLIALWKKTVVLNIIPPTDTETRKLIIGN